MKNILWIIPLLLSALSLSAQKINISRLYADKNLILNVKQYGQFIKRFNYVEDFSGNSITEAFKKKIDRANYILYLFNNKDNRLTDSIFLKSIESFLNSVIKDSLLIDRLSDSTFALLKCRVTYNKVPQKLYLVLHTQKINKGYRWAICDAYAGFIHKENTSMENIPAFVYNNSKLIPPTSNEVNFTHLRAVFKDKENFSMYISNKWAGSNLASLIKAMQTNDLEFNHVENLKYYIFDIDGWAIEVSEFIRNTENSGWLISNLEKCNNAERYMSQIMNSLQVNE